MWVFQRESVPHTPLHEACLRQSLESVKNIVHSGEFDIDCENELRYSPLGVIALEIFAKSIRGHRTEDRLEYEEKLKFLLKNGADPMKENSGVTVAEIIFRGGNKNVINMVLRYIPDINSPLNVAGQTALHLAIRKGFYKTAKNILAMKADINKVGYGYSPLQCAVLFGKAACINLLIKHGANMHTRNDSEETLLHIACYNTYEREKVQRLLQPHVYFEDRFLCYAQQECFHPTVNPVITQEIVELLLDKGFYLEDKDKLGFTPLYRCIGRKIDTLALVLLMNDDALLEISTNKALVLMKRISPISTEIWEIGKVILKFIALKISKGIPINETLEQSLNELKEAKDYLNECNVEIRFFKTYKIENTNVTYWSLLTKSIKEIALLCANNQIMIEPVTFVIEGFHPIYAPDLIYKFSKGRKRQKLIASCVETLDRMCDGKLPSLFLHMVMDRLSIADMQNLKNAGQYI